ncbi:MAG: Asp-tRNA(Asn)/Glu-tRNA(Gln) amidotransferase subunit GatC [Patescibacteria group bacterium]|jgi:aspartyl-tRNA(Asn)/glutamyl-tRNA(Gln) amidotransferase subunit C
MAKLSKTDVEYIAKLARLNLSEPEKDKFARQLSSVLEYVDQLSEVNTENVEPTAQVTGLTNISREDIVERSEIGYAEIELNAPEFESKSFKVPGVFANGDEEI